MAVELRLLRNPSEQTVTDLTEVVLGAPEYCQICEGRLPKAEDIPEMLSALPPNCQIEQKYFFGVYVGEKMIGCADVIRGWPTLNQCHIGLLLLAEKYQGQGYGKHTFTELRSCFIEWPEIKKLRIAVVESNQKAFPFWHGMGFRETGVRIKSPTFVADLVILELPFATNA